MNCIFNIDKFISDHVTKRQESLFAHDIHANYNALTDQINNKNVLIIGGAGSIGASFIKALLPFRPSGLVVVDINENGLTELVRDCRSSNDVKLPEDFKSYPVNFSDPVFEKLFHKEGPFDIIANFAAHKHVRSEKDIFSIEGLLENNVIRAKKLLDLLAKNPPSHFFCVSTDKAANPVNIMGASKKLMENMIMSYSDVIKVTTARFANVAFSNGSLLAGFLERIGKQQPIASPNDVRRYFVSPKESGEICLLACVLGKSSEIFFPKIDTSEMKTFSEIADSLLNEMGYTPDRCQSEDEAKQKASQMTDTGKKYPVYYFQSDTTGEKEYEEFFTSDEEVDLKTFSSLGIIRNSKKTPLQEIQKQLSDLALLFDNPNAKKEDVVRFLQSYVPGFHHTETGKNLDSKM